MKTPIIAAALLLAACGKPEPPPAVEDTVFGDQVETLDRARAVQDDVDARKRDLDERMRESEGN